MRSSLFLAVPLMLLLTILQTAVLPQVPLLGLAPLLPFLFALAWGLLQGINEGILWGFVAGMFNDLFSVAPLGGSAITYMIAILIVTFLNQALPVNRFILPTIFAATASLIQLLLYFLFLQLLNTGITFQLAQSLLPTILLHGLLILPVYWLLYPIGQALWPPKVEI